jgi:hypothetical protein
VVADPEAQIWRQLIRLKFSSGLQQLYFSLGISFKLWWIMLIIRNCTSHSPLQWTYCEKRQYYYLFPSKLFSSEFSILKITWSCKVKSFVSKSGSSVLIANEILLYDSIISKTF